LKKHSLIQTTIQQKGSSGITGFSTAAAGDVCAKKSAADALTEHATKADRKGCVRKKSSKAVTAPSKVPAIKGILWYVRRIFGSKGCGLDGRKL